MQRYRSGHNEAVLKTVCPKGHVGSNPTLCVKNHQFNLGGFLMQYDFGEVPKRLKGLPWKGSRSLIAVRGFKSRLLRFILYDAKYVEAPVGAFCYLLQFIR